MNVPLQSVLKLIFPLPLDFLLLNKTCRVGSPSSFSASTACLSLWHTLAHFAAELTFYCKQAVRGQFVMYLHIILLFLSISRGT